MVALTPGFYKKRIREGQIFMFTGIPGKWMVPTGKAVKPAKKDKAEAPNTLSGIQKAEIADEKVNEA